MVCTNSSQDFLVASGSARKPPSSVHVAERPVPNSRRPPERMSSTAARSATRTGWLNCGTQTTMPWPTRMFLVCTAQAVRNSSGAEQWRVLLEEVVLDRPHRVEAELVGQADLLQGVHVHLALGLPRPTDAAPTARRRPRTSSARTPDLWWRQAISRRWCAAGGSSLAGGSCRGTAHDPRCASLRCGRGRPFLATRRTRRSASLRAP